MKREDLAFTDPVVSCSDCAHFRGTSLTVDPTCVARDLGRLAHQMRESYGLCGLKAALFEPKFATKGVAAG